MNGLKLMKIYYKQVALDKHVFEIEIIFILFFLSH